jgi:hypothetical protein
MDRAMRRHAAISAVPTYGFLAERRNDLARLGVTEAQIAELELILPGCYALIEEYPTLTDTQDEFQQLIAALDGVKRVFEPHTKCAREALNRWQMAAHALCHQFGSDPEFAHKLGLDTLLRAARDAQHGLGVKQRRSRAANPEPIRRISDALSFGWARGHGDKPRTAYRMPPGKFREIVQIAYEAMGANAGQDYMPERALRGYNAWRKKEAAKRAVEWETIT